MHSPDRKPSALEYSLLTYMTLVVAAITLIPFEFKIPGRIYINLHSTVSDLRLADDPAACRMAQRARL